jgi:hypothetical protein
MKGTTLVKIIYMDGYDEIRNADTHDVVFSTKLPDYITKYIDRTTMDDAVIDNVVNIWNKLTDTDNMVGQGSNLDNYLLNEGKCTQEEREIIIESLYDYMTNQ